MSHTSSRVFLRSALSILAFLGAVGLSRAASCSPTPLSNNPPWFDFSISDTASCACGTATYSGGTYTINSQEEDIFGTADRFNFVYQAVTGDFEIVGRLLTVGPPALRKASAGLMVREKLTPESRNLFLEYQYYGEASPPITVPPTLPDPPFGRGIWRPWDGDTSAFSSPVLDFHATASCDCALSNCCGLPLYQKIVRLKDQITAYQSLDKIHWDWVEGSTLTGLSASTVYVGMAVRTNNNTCAPTEATFDSVTIKTPTLAQNTSWYANTFPGGRTYVQQDINTLYVDPGPNIDPLTGASVNEARIYTNGIWDEGAAEAAIYDTNGKLERRLYDTHAYSRLGGYAVTTSASYVFMGMVQDYYGNPPESNCNPATCCLYDQSPCVPCSAPAPGYPACGTRWFSVRRFDKRGNPAPITGAGLIEGEGYDKSLRIVSTVDHVRGLAFKRTAGKLYVSDPGTDMIRVYDENLQPLSGSDFPVARPRGMAVDTNGNLRIIQAVDPGDPWFHPAKVGRYNPMTGEELTGVILPADPTGVSVDRSGNVWVAENGSDMFIRKYTSGGAQLSTFGDRYGIYSGVKGAVQPKKFNGIFGLGIDDIDPSNVYVYVGSDGPKGGSGTEIRKLRADNSSLIWQDNGLSFVDTGDFDPDTDGVDLFDKDAHYLMDYSKPNGQQWTYKGMTLDTFIYPEDYRLHGDAAGASGVYVRRVADGGGVRRRFMYLNTDYGDYLAIYRFDPNTEIAIPCGLFSKSFPVTVGGWPPNLPGPSDSRYGHKLIWVDANGDGAIQATEYEDDGSPAPYRWSWSVDAAGDVWTTSSAFPAEIRKYAFQGINGYGCPVYHSGSSTTYPVPANGNNVTFTEVLQADYVPATQTMYLAGYTTDHPRDTICDSDGNLCDLPGSKNIGTEIVRYDAWGASGGTFAWRIQDLPYSEQSNYIHAARDVSVAGNRVFVGIGDSAEIREYDTGTGAFLKKLSPGPEVGGKSARIITAAEVNAFRRNNGEYLVSVVELLMAKELLYRDPLYHDTFNAGADPFTAVYAPAGTTSLVTIAERPNPNGDAADVSNKAVEFRATGGTFEANLFKVSVTSGLLLDRLNQVYHLPVGSPSVKFDFSFKLERTASSNRPTSGGISAGIRFNFSDSTNSSPTGSPNPSLFGTVPYSATHDEPSGSEVLEMVDLNDIATYRFTVVPIGPGGRNISSVELQFGVQTVPTPQGQPATTPEAYAIDDLSINEVSP